MNILEHPIYKSIYDLCQEIEKLPASEQATKVVVMASALEQPVAKLIGTVRALEAQSKACREIMGYTDGDLLEDVRRYHEYATHEIKTLRDGGERLVAYCRKLQELLPQDTVMKMGFTAVQESVASVPNDGADLPRK